MHAWGHALKLWFTKCVINRLSHDIWSQGDVQGLMQEFDGMSYNATVLPSSSLGRFNLSSEFLFILHVSAIPND